VVPGQPSAAQRGIESARADRPVVGILLRHLQIISQPQRFRNARGAGTPDVLLRDDSSNKCEGRLTISGLTSGNCTRILSGGNAGCDFRGSFGKRSSCCNAIAPSTVSMTDAAGRFKLSGNVLEREALHFVRRPRDP
jgi:hypothetical protein